MCRDNFNDLFKQFQQLGIQDAIDFDKMNDILISHHSTAIEGSSLTEEETLLLLTEGITAKGKPLEDHNMVKDHHTALLETIRLAKEKNKVTPELIQSLSALVMKTTGGEINSMAGTHDSSKGDFRKSSVHVGARYFTNYQKVPREVEKLCDFINDKLAGIQTPEEIYNLAFDAHFILVSIHPFADGNGRVSRLLMNYILEYNNLLHAIIFTEDKADYYTALEETREKEDMTPFRNFMYSQQEKYFNQEIDKFQKADQNEFWNTYKK